MGRKKLYKTEAQRKAQRRKWVANSNKTRRERYATDPAYRQSVSRASREAGRTRRGGVIQPRAEITAHSLETLPAHGEVRRLVDSSDGTVTSRRVKTFTSPELASMLGLANYGTMNEWQNTGKIPRPTAVAKVGKGNAEVYLLHQVKGILSVMADHFKVKNQLRATDQQTVDALFAAMK